MNELLYLNYEISQQDLDIENLKDKNNSKKDKKNKSERK